MLRVSLPLDHQIRLVIAIIKAEALGNIAQEGISMSDFRNFTTACLACMDTDKHLSTSQHPCGESKYCNYYLIAGEQKYRENKRLAQRPIIKAVPFLTPGKHPEDRVSFLSRITLSHEAIADFCTKTQAALFLTVRWMDVSLFFKTNSYFNRKGHC